MKPTTLSLISRWCKSAPLALALGAGCATAGEPGLSSPGDDGGDGRDGGSPAFGDDGSPSFGDAGGSGGDPRTCAEAEAAHSYVGCDYWPTVVGNYVWSIF